MVVIGRQVDLCESEASLVCMVAPCSMFPCRRQEEEAGVWVMGLEMGAEVGSLGGWAEKTRSAALGV